jgi:hypothetical protein
MKELSDGCFYLLIAAFTFGLCDRFVQVLYKPDAISIGLFFIAAFCGVAVVLTRSEDFLK